MGEDEGTISNLDLIPVLQDVFLRNLDSVHLRAGKDPPTWDM